MTDAADFLVEIGTEELPPKSLRNLSERFAAELETRVRGAGLSFTAVMALASPRRLAVSLTALARTQGVQLIEKRGPAISAAFNAAGEPTPAALGFARSCGAEFVALTRLKTDKGEWLIYRSEQPGRAAAELLPEMVAAALSALPIPKRMRWGARAEEFVRPVHWVVMLHGASVVPATILGIHSSNTTRGHRFMGTPRIPLQRANEYVARLATEGRVLVDFAARRARVQQMVMDTASANGGCALMDDALLDEVTALVEWPAPIVGSFDPQYLSVPREALIATMQGNQKYFPLEDAQGHLLNRFITISNIESPEPDLIREGNERVIRPRLSDAAFFFNKDRKIPLGERLASLGDIVFERRLGSLLEKSERVANLARELATSFGAAPESAHRAARLSRCDLLTEMVGEFPELQGTMGRYYAAEAGEPVEIASALGDFYRPRYAGDAIPATPLGRCVALADRLDTLAGIFSIGGAPSGDRDPYALRRAALGALRICIEGTVPLDLTAALQGVAERNQAPPEVATQVYDFMLERTRGYFSDRGVRGDVIEAVLATRPGSPLDLARRIAAVETFLELPEAAALAAANKRIANILRKAELGAAEFNPALMTDPAERTLAASLSQLAATTAGQLASANYEVYLAALAKLRMPVDQFFEQVMVMADDLTVRANRLALLQQIHQLFLRVADIAVIAI